MLLRLTSKSIFNKPYPSVITGVVIGAVVCASTCWDLAIVRPFESKAVTTMKYVVAGRKLPINMSCSFADTFRICGWNMDEIGGI